MHHLAAYALLIWEFVKPWALAAAAFGLASAALTVLVMLKLTAFGRAIDRLRVSERQTAELRAKVGLATPTTYEGLWRIDCAARTVYVNERIATMFESQVHDILGVSVFTLLSDASAELLRPCLRLADPQPARDVDVEFRRRDGSLFTATISIEALRDEVDGRRTGFMIHALDRSEHSALTEQLAQNERRWWSIANALGHPLFLTDAAGTVEAGNAAWLACAGMSDAQMRSHWDTALHPDDAAPAIAHWKSALATATTFRATLRVRGPSGTYRWFAAHTAPIETDAGASFVNVWFDIDPYVTARDTVAVIEALGDFALVRTAVENVAYVSPGLERLTGVPAAACRAEGAAAFIHPEDAGAFASGEPADVRIRAAAGGHRWFHVLPLELAAGGMPERRISALADIDELRQTQRSLERSDGRYRALTAALPQLVWFADASGHIEYVSERWIAYTGTATRPGATLESTGILHPDDAAALPAPGAAVRGDAEYEVRLRRHDGVYRWHAIRIAELGGDDPAAATRVVTATDIENRKSAELALSQSTAQLMHRVHHDPVTNLPDRGRFQSGLTRKIGTAGQSRGRVAVLSIDVGNFKTINTSLGHAAGDRVLIETAARIRAVLGDDGIVSRPGGNEFLAACGVRLGIGATRIAERLLAAMREPMVVNGKRIVAPCSIGVALFPDDARDGAALLTAADGAMLAAKRAGGNGWCRAGDRDDPVIANAELCMDLELRDALAADQFVMHYQPVFDLASGRTVGAEALLRWAHPARGLIAPDEFIPFAETHGLIGPIGAYVVNAACAQLSRLRAYPDPDFAISINISAHEFAQPHFVLALTAAVEAHAVDARRLEIELTERTALTGSPAVNATLDGLRSLGVKLALDDFGTGYSSLSYLTEFPVHTLKIDRSFIAGLTTQPAQRQVAKTVIGLGTALGLRVVAEGVETTEQLDELRTLGADCVQGFVLSRPLPAPDFEKFIAAHRMGTRLNEM